MRQLFRHTGSMVVLGITLAVALPAAPVTAAPASPTVIGVHRNAAVDVHGNSTFGTVAQESLPAGNWMITAKGELFGYVSLIRIECQLVIGPTLYKSRVWTTAGGTGSVKDMTLLMGYHLNTTGKVVLKCYSDVGTGDVLIRDVQLSAIKLGTLTNDVGTYTASAGPRAFEHNNLSPQSVSGGAFQTVGQLSLPAGTWFLQSAVWVGLDINAPDELQCRLRSGTSAQLIDQSELETTEHDDWIGLEGVVHLASPETVNVDCEDVLGPYGVFEATLTAIKVGTLTLRHLVPGGAVTTTGSGNPFVVEGYSDDAKSIATSATLKQTDAVPLGSGSWLVSAKLSVGVSDSSTETVNCQLRLGSRVDNARSKADASSQQWSWQSMALTGNLTSTTKAQLLCDQTSSSLAGRFHVRITAIKLGSLTDTLLP